MRNRRFNVAVAGSVSVLFVMACLSQLQANDPKADKEDTPEIVKAANGALKAAQAEHNWQQADAADIYDWSRRLMEAELTHGTNKKAALDHVTRMRHLHELAEALFKNAAKGGSEREFHATHYYLLEAQAKALEQKN